MTRFVVSLVAAVPLVAWWGSDRVCPPVPSTPPRLLSVDQHAVSLGAVEPQPAVGAVYQLTNRSDEPLRIERCETSCGCLEPRIDTDAIAPGETVPLRVVMKTAGERPGLHEQTVFVDVAAAGGTTESRELRFSVVLPEASVVVSPRSLMFYQLRGQSGRKSVTLTDARSQPTAVTGVRIVDVAGADRVSDFAEVVTVTAEPSGATAEIAVREGLPPGRRTGWVIFETDDPSQPRHKVPLLLEGRFDRRTASR